MGLDKRKKSGRIFGGSQLNVDGQGIYSVKIITPNLSNKTKKPNLEDIVVIPPSPPVTCYIQTQKFNTILTQGFDRLIWC